VSIKPSSTVSGPPLGLGVNDLSGRCRAVCRRTIAIEVSEIRETLSRSSEALKSWLRSLVSRIAGQEAKADVASVAEEVRRKEFEIAKSIRDGIGDAILKDESIPASNLRSFLNKVHQECTTKEMQTPDEAGVAFHFCLEMVQRSSQAEFSRTFTRLEEEWLQNGIGERLLSSHTSAAQNMRSLLCDVYREFTGKDVEGPSDLGRVYYQCWQMTEDLPDDDGSKLFQALDSAWTVEERVRPSQPQRTAS
jgi:hypothetical protein